MELEAALLELQGEGVRTKDCLMQEKVFHSWRSSVKLAVKIHCSYVPLGRRVVAPRFSNKHSPQNNLAAQCNFLVKNFDIRQSGFQTEIEALNQALAILSGSGLEAAMAEAGLVQKERGFLRK